MKKILVAVVLLLVIKNSYSQFARETKEDITPAFFKAYEKDPLKAYINVFAGNKWIENQSSALETNAIKLRDLLKQIGEYEGYEFITEKRVGSSYILKSYLVRYERQPLRFTFMLYKPKETWIVQNFSYDTELDEELKEAAKIDRLRENWE